MAPDPTPRPLILVVEDNPANLLLTCAVLRRAGWRVVEARSAPEALAALQGERPQLILMDVQLPGVDGLTLTRQLKANPATTAIPVVALTANVMSGDAEQCLAAGCDGYLAKPIDTRTFAASVAAYLDLPPPLPVVRERP